MGPPAPGRIPWSVVMEWATHNGYEGETADLFDRLIGEMDAEYMDWWRESQERGE